MLHYRLIFMGLSASFIGLGIGRFAFTALMPALIEKGYFSQIDAGYLGAANMFGYVVGAASANMLANRIASPLIIKYAIAIIVISYPACALIELPFSWYFIWRFLAGQMGAYLIILALPIALRAHDQKLRGRVSGVVFSGIGIGTLASALVFPYFIQFGMAAAWVAPGGIAGGLMLYFWRFLTQLECNEKAQNNSSGDHKSQDSLKFSPQVIFPLACIMAAYGFDALGYLPHSIFWVDHIVRALGYNYNYGGFFWAIFGVGAMIAPLIVGYASDYLGFRNCLLMAFILKACGVALPIFFEGFLALFISSFLVGAFTPAMVSLMASYCLEIVGADLHRRAWGLMTLSFAVMVALGGTIMVEIADILGSYKALFGFSSLSLLAGLGLILFSKTK